MSTPAVASGIFSIRRRLGEKLEIYADGLYSWNNGKLQAGPGNLYQAGADAAENPFSQAVTLRPPGPAFGSTVWTRTQTGRLTAGLIASLPWNWKATADYAVGRPWST